MEIKFSCSGGFTNIHLEYQTDISQLPDDVAQELIRLIEDTNIFDDSVIHQESVDQMFPDAISYQLQLTQELHTTEIVCSDANAPDELRPLLARLRRLAITEKRKGSL